MQQKFVFNLILLVFLNLLVKPFYILGIDTEILDRVGQQEYGLYFALMNLSFMLNIFLDLGTVNFNTNYIAKHSHLVSKHFSRIMALRLGLMILYFFVCMGTAILLGYQGRAIYLLMPICVNQILAGLILYFRSNLSGLQLYERDSIISVLDRLILIILCSAVLWGNFTGYKMTIEMFILFQMYAYGATALIAYFMLRNQIKQTWPKLNIRFSWIVLRKSFPYALLILLMNFYYRTDGIMLERLLENGAYEAGIYAQGFRFFEAGNMIAYLFSALLFPMFSRLLGEGKNVTALLQLSFRIILIIAVIGGIGGFFFSRDIMEMRFSSGIEPASDAFQYLMIGFLGMSGTYVFGSLLTANGNLKELNTLAVAGAIFNIILNLILIPGLKATGAAIASMITQILITISQVILVRMKTHAHIQVSLVLRSFLFIGMAVFICWACKSFFQEWIVAILTFAILTVGIAFIIRMLSFQSLMQYVRFSRNLE